MFISTTLLQFLKAYPNCMHQYGNHEPREKDTDQTDQDGHQASERGCDNNIAVTDGQSRDKGKVQRVGKRHLLNKSDRNSTGHHQSDKRQNNGK